jgi:hypothetical protein
MSLITTLFQRIGVLGFVEGRLPTEVQVPRDAPSKVPPMSPHDELALLEKTALEKGISSDELATTRRIGECPAQVQARITHLHKWLAAHKSARNAHAPTGHVRTADEQAPSLRASCRSSSGEKEGGVCLLEHGRSA